MAGIKSTMDLVMERAARMGIATPDEMRREEDLKTGMQLTAAYLNGQQASLAAVLAEQDEGQQRAHPPGHARIAPAQRLPAPRGGRPASASAGPCRASSSSTRGSAISPRSVKELQTIASQYGQHRTQLYDQLKEQMRLQIEQLLAREGA